MSNYTPFGKVCRVVFAETNSSPKAFAARCGVGYSFLNGVMNGNKPLCISLVAELIDFYPTYAARIRQAASETMQHAYIDLRMYNDEGKLEIVTFLLNHRAAEGK